jgi:hypothetical protein
VRNTIEKAQAPVNKAIDWVINQAVKLVKAAGKFFSGMFGKKEKEQAEPTKDGTRDAQTVARNTLHERLGQETSVAAAEQVVAATAAELKPIGVKRIEIGAEQKDGSRPILVEASPLTRVSALIARKVAVAVSVKITMRKEEPKGVLESILKAPQKTWLGTFGETMQFMKTPGAEGTGRTAPLPPVSQPSRTPARLGDQPSGGVILEPEGQARELEILAWNTGVSIGRKDARGEYETNVSHAEHQFVDWFMDRPLAWRKRVASVEMIVQSSSKSVTKICEKCSADIAKIEKAHPGITHVTFIAAGQAEPKEEKVDVKE